MLIKSVFAKMPYRRLQTGGLLIAICLSLQGCFLPTNSVQESWLDTSRVEPSVTQIVFGVRAIEKWPFERFSLSIDQYYPSLGSVGDNCNRYNRATAELAPTPDKLTYFTFDVPAGNYTYSVLNTYDLDATAPTTFIVPEGRKTYLGDYIYSGGNKLNFKRDIVAAKSSLGLAAAMLEVAEVLPGVHRGFVRACAF